MSTCPRIEAQRFRARVTNPDNATLDAITFIGEGLFHFEATVVGECHARTHHARPPAYISAAVGLRSHSVLTPLLAALVFARSGETLDEQGGRVSYCKLTTQFKVFVTKPPLARTYDSVAACSTLVLGSLGLLLAYEQARRAEGGRFMVQ